MLGLCTKHCTFLILVAMAITIALGSTGTPSLLHIPLSGTNCVRAWTGWPFGYRAFDVLCENKPGRLLNYFVNGFLNVLVFFIPLRLLHDRYWHRKPELNNKNTNAPSQ